MQISSYEGRIQQKKILGVPTDTFTLGLVALTAGAIAVIVPVVIFKLTMAFVAIGMTIVSLNAYVERDNWLVKLALSKGTVLFKLPTFSRSKSKTYASEHSWWTYIGNHGIAHKDSSVSIAFEWDGTHNRYWDNAELGNNHNSRVGMLRYFNNSSVCIEHHFCREKDESRIDDYLSYQKKINPDAPKIVSQITKEMGELYRPMARTNRVSTVITVSNDKKGFFSFLSKAVGTHKSWKMLEKECLKIFKSVSHDYDGARLLTSDEFASFIQECIYPYKVTNQIDWRYDLSEQLITEKPDYDMEDDLLIIDGRYHKVCVVQNYPILSYDWFISLCETSIDFRATQILHPKQLEKSLDKSYKDVGDEASTSSKKRGVDRLNTKIKDSRKYRNYISDNKLPVFDNAFIVVYHDEDKEKVIKFSDRFTKFVNKHGGMVRSDRDLQYAMFQASLPGQGICSAFRREDHGDVVAALMPFTTFSSGSKEPESLRITISGHPVTFSPSELEVAHELVVAQTNGGKDTQFGAKIIETYSLVRYDIVELGNSYQGLIEAIGGRYCRAREQVINPMASYAEIVEAIDTGNKKIYSTAIIVQSQIILPIFKGFGGSDYTNAEKVVVGNILKYVYENPNIGKEAPVLPDLVAAFDCIETSSDGQVAAVKLLKAELSEFLITPAGENFTEQDQYTISPIANAIDFSGLEGDIFDYYFSFTATRLASNAMSNSKRCQIVFNEYKVLLERAPEVVKHITWTIDRMGRKDCVGLTRISQGMEEIKSVDSEAIDSIPNKTLLSRRTKHEEIGALVQMPHAAILEWKNFLPPEKIKKMNYRESFVCESGEWFRLNLRFPQIHLDLMNTVGADKEIREAVYAKESDTFKRIAEFKRLAGIRDNEKQQLLVKDEKTTDDPSARQPML